MRAFGSVRPAPSDTRRDHSRQDGADLSPRQVLKMSRCCNRKSSTDALEHPVCPGVRWRRRRRDRSHTMIPSSAWCLDLAVPYRLVPESSRQNWVCYPRNMQDRGIGRTEPDSHGLLRADPSGLRRQVARVPSSPCDCSRRDPWARSLSDPGHAVGLSFSSGRMGRSHRRCGTSTKGSSERLRAPSTRRHLRLSRQASCF